MSHAFSINNGKQKHNHNISSGGRGVVSYYFVLGASACRKGDPKTFVLGTSVNRGKFLVYLKLASEATAKKTLGKMHV